MVPDQVVASVNSVKGQAFARGPDGDVRPLTAGSPLYDGETLITDPDSAVVLNPDDGSPPFLVPGKMELAMAPPVPDDAEIDPETLGELIKRFETEDEFDPPEAGGGGGSRPHNFVMLERIIEEVNPMDLDFSAPVFNGEGPIQGIDLSLSLGDRGDGGETPPPEPPPPEPPSTWAPANDHYTVIEDTTDNSMASVLTNDNAGPGAKVVQVFANGEWHNVPTGGFSFDTPLEGRVTIYQDGTFLYNAPVRYNSGNGVDTDGPDEDSFLYRVENSGGDVKEATAFIDILDTVPIANDDDYTLSQLQAALRISDNVMTNDIMSADTTKIGAGPKDPVENIVWQIRTDENSASVSVPDTKYNPGGPAMLETVRGGLVWINQDGSFEYRAPRDFIGDDSFQYQLNDGDNSPSNWATVTFHVPGPPTRVEPVDDHYEVVEATSTPLDAPMASVLTNDNAGPGATVGQVLVNGRWEDVPADGLWFKTPMGGEVTIFQDGTFLYTAPTRYNSGNGVDTDGPDVDSFRYCVKGSSTSATAYINILDTVPIANDDDYALSQLQAALRISDNVMTNDIMSADTTKVGASPTDPIENIVWQIRADENSASVSVPDTKYNPGGPAMLETVHGGLVWINQDGSFEYRAPRDFIGDDSFQYQLTDGDNSPSNWATVTFHVPGPPIKPVDDHYDVMEATSTDPSAPMASVLANDKAGHDATVGQVLVNGDWQNVPADGLTFGTLLEGKVTIFQDGTFLYTAPTRDHSDNIPDVDSFQYRVKDASGTVRDASATAYINILDSVPVANDDDYALSKLQAALRLSDNVLSNDIMSADYIKDGSDPIQNIVWQVRADENAASISVPDSEYNPGGPATLTTANGGLVWINQDGSFEYRAPWSFIGDDSFQYQLNDGDGSPSNWATVTFHVPGPEKLTAGGVGHEELNSTDGVVDIFKWSLSDLGDGADVTNTVTGFNLREGDKLDLRDLLQQGNDYLFNTAHLDVSVDNGNTLIAVTPVDTSAPTLNIVLEGVDLGYQGQDAIDQLLKNGNLVDDR
ncbi:MAG: retention module-containing protein [Betaproteobacteria bacterium]|nr:retention module-containing protein [Betaproteobacteria bacterium]